MQKKRYNIEALALGAVIATACSSAGNIAASAEESEGQTSPEWMIEDWAYGEAALMSWAGGPPLRVGSVGADGSISLELPQTVSTSQPLNRVFSCSDNPDFIATNPDVLYEITASSLMVGKPEEEEMFGYVVAGTTEGAAKARLSPGEAPPMQGSTYQWLYVEETAGFKGICFSDLYAEGDTPTRVTVEYDMDLEPGWNILEHEVNDVMTTTDDRTYLTDHAYRTVDHLPDGVLWMFAEE